MQDAELAEARCSGAYVSDDRSTAAQRKRRRHAVADADVDPIDAARSARSADV
jgi:hypothetical protein